MTSVASAWSAPVFESAAGYLRQRTGLEFLPNRWKDFEGGMRRVMGRAGIEEPERFLDRLRADDALLDELIAESTVGETYFFREPAQFSFIRDVVIREWAESGRTAGFRAWSAGCASGEEAYSLAILLEELGLARRSHVLGTDISRPSLARAREAVYGRWSLRSVDAAFSSRYFDARGDRWALHPRFRERVAFEYLNLASDNFPSLASGAWGMDLILCRNVLIYFDSATIRRVAERLAASLVEGGWLVTGPSDPPLGGVGGLESVVTPAGVFYRARRDGRLAASPGAPDAAAAPPPPPAEREPLAVAPPSEEQAAQSEAPIEAPAADAVLIKTLAGERGAETAVLAAADATRRHPLSAEIHFLHALLAMETGDYAQAARSARRALYLDRSLAIGHFTLGCVLRRRGDASGARRSFENALKLCLARPADELLPLSDGERVRQLIRAARAELALLEARQ